jgi:hypothetical protein
MVKKQFFLNLFLFIVCFFSLADNQIGTSAVTYRHWYGRLGDKLLLYIKARWFSYYFKIPFFYRPFQYSDEFMMHSKELYWSENYRKNFKKIITAKSVPGAINPNDRILYEVDYYISNIQVFNVIQNQEFHNLIKAMIAPAKPVPLVPRQNNKHCVALHVRKGGGYDSSLSSQQIYRVLEKASPKLADQAWPLKFPPDQYYLDQIVKLSEMLNHEPLYIYLFTDDQDPGSIADRYEKYLNKPNITFAYRQKDNHHEKNVVEDLFGITQFDYYIRGDSHFAQIADVIGNHKIVISPKNYKWEGNKLIISEVNVAIKNSIFINT